MSDPVRSPITGETKTVFEADIDVATVIDLYAKGYGIDVRKHFHNISRIEIHRCLETGYRFYYPFTMAGDGAFYEKMQSFDWYYMDWKWEHQIVSQQVRQGDHILEIGCGKASFLKRMANEFGVNCVGLELNAGAIPSTLPDRCSVLQESIEVFSQKNSGRFDWVCLFQVLEHISDIKSFLLAALESLKPGGRLVISVPNNRSFIRHAKNSILNMPPHHMGLWDVGSICGLQTIFDLELDNTFYEPLEPQHVRFYTAVQIGRILPRNTLLQKAVYRTVVPWVAIFVGIFRKRIVGHTILCILKKPSIKDKK